MGSPGESSSGSGIDGDQSEGTGGAHGAVYVFHRNGTTWSQEAYVKASNTSALPGSFGGAVALFGDTLAVADVQEAGAAMGVGGDQATQDAMGNPLRGGAGAVYVFQRIGVTWSQQSYVKATNPGGSGLEFGGAVALSADTLVVGAWGAPGAGGSIFVFDRALDTWTPNTTLVDSPNGLSGFVVAVSGETLAGMSFDAPGAVLIFKRTGAVWALSARVELPVSPFPADGLQIASATHPLALCAGRIAVGVFGESTNARGVDGRAAAQLAGAGTVYLFEETNHVWSLSHRVNPSNPRAATGFGNVVAMSPDTLVVGREGEESNAVGVNGDQTNTSAIGAGAAYVY